jgi:hypothetical protein
VNTARQFKSRHLFNERCDVLVPLDSIAVDAGNRRIRNPKQAGSFHRSDARTG